MVEDSRSDLDLIRALRRGDTAAFETLYRRYRDWIASLAYEFCGNREDALDVLQDAFAYFLRKLPGFELRAKFKTFFYPVVKHLALTRKAQSRPRPMPTPPEPREPGSIDDIIAALPDEQREVVRLRFADDLSLQEIADTLEIPLGTVKSRLHAALESLRRNRRTFSDP